MKNIYVLMSTFNGQTYLAEQLDSILKQKEVNVTIYVRDDGSTDNTGDILESYSKKYGNIYYCKGKNVGYGKSFIDLLKQVPANADFFAFSDQDDVWMPDKLIKGIRVLENEKGAALYCALPQYVDKDLNPLSGYSSFSDYLPTGNIKSEWALATGIWGLGCTMIWNKSLQLIARNVSFDGFDFGHDNFMSVLAPLVGKMYKDTERVLLYRQHGNNAGANKSNTVSFRSKIKNKMKQHKAQESFKLRKAIEDQFFDSVLEESKEILCLSTRYKLSILSKIKLILKNYARDLGNRERKKFIIRVLLNDF